MSYAIVGAGKVGQALARAFARKGIEVARFARASARKILGSADFSGFRQVQVKQSAAAVFVHYPLKGEHHAHDRFLLA